MKRRTKDGNEGSLSVKGYVKPEVDPGSIIEAKLSPTSKWHNKCVAEYEWDSGKKKKKKKSTKKYPDEVVKFVEGAPQQSNLDAKQKYVGIAKRKNPKYSTQVRFLEHKYIQCNIMAADDDVEVSLPDEIKPLLINVTFLLHELKQRSESKRVDQLCEAIMRITTLLMELSRRPIRKVDDDSPKPFDEMSWKLVDILKEAMEPEDERYENLLQEIEHLKEELIQKDSEVNYVKEQILEERERLMPRATDLKDCLRNSIIKNQSLRAEIKFNKAQFRQYAKALSKKEELKQKSLLELNILRKKCAKLEQGVESGAKATRLRQTNTESDVSHGGSMTKYIKSKVVKEKKKQKTVRSGGKVLARHGGK